MSLRALSNRAGLTPALPGLDGAAGRLDLAGSSPARQQWPRPSAVRLDRLLVGLVLVAAWWAASALYGSYWVPSPAATLSRFVAELASGALLQHAAYTAMATVLGFAIGAPPAVLLPLALRRLTLLARVLDPFITAGYTVPKLAIAPLLILWFGIGIGAKVALVSVSVFFIIYCHATAGISSVDGRLIRMARLAGSREWDLVRHVILPGATPYMLAGVRLAIPYAIGGVVIAELLSADRGLGYVVQLAASGFDATGVFAALLAVAALTGTATATATVLERRLVPWHARRKQGNG